MDKGELWKYEFEVLPASNGSFIVTLGREYERHVRGKPNNIGDTPERWAFTNVHDLLAFLHAQIGPDPRVNPDDQSTVG